MATETGRIKGRIGRRREPEEIPLKFDQKLVLNQWMFRLLEVRGFEELALALKPPEFEGFSEDGVSRFYEVLRATLFDRKEMPFDLLLQYDQNIVRHWKAITVQRNQAGHILYPKYFQYLSLLFTEIYLDRYFQDNEALLNRLNEHVAEFNNGKFPTMPGLLPTPRNQANQVEPFKAEELNKLAFWSATGSGKTLLMHINILQYRHYLARAKRERELNRIILLTPNEGLSNQHLEEFALSGMEAELFTGGGVGLFAGQSVEIIDIHKLRDEEGDKTFAIDAFEGNNLVLVDEGHRGTSSEAGEWLKKRNKLCEIGFSFEYSATFGQAMRASNSKTLEQTYAKCILLDYSYKYFHRDGYGKDFKILNLEDDHVVEIRKRYLTACLLAFYQQKKFFAEYRNELARFLVHQPLWVFVGGSVNAVRVVDGEKFSDVVDILHFLAEFVQDRAASIDHLQRLLQGRSDLPDLAGHDLFAPIFTFLYSQKLDATQLFEDILKTLFNTPAAGKFHVENLKGTDGEIALRIGENEPFGVINVGDTSALCKLCEEHEEFATTEREFSGSLFRSLNDDESKVNILIGSKKFSEGWSSWRVSTMGLMNIGKSEGPQIIQLFGRGVRLKGFEFCLKRSNRVDGCSPPKHIALIETLNIFGIRADYMRQFREYLENEGLNTENRIEFVMPVVKNLGKQKLKTIRLQAGKDFKVQAPKPSLKWDHEAFHRYRVFVDWYPRIQELSSAGAGISVDLIEKEQGVLGTEHLAFMNMDVLYFELQQFKNERAWYNFNLSKNEMEQLLRRNDWYTLLVPSHQLEFRHFDQISQWQEIALTLLKKFCDRLYKFKKAKWEGEFLEYRELDESDPNFFDHYKVLVEQSAQDIVDKLGELKTLVESGKLTAWQFKNLEAFGFQWHLYRPLLYANSELVEIQPVVLESPSELDFIKDLQRFCDGNKEIFDGKELYVLRNMSRGHGVGFFEEGNFYPDFIVWLVVGEHQFITFVDPKGIRNLQGTDDPKIHFYKTIKTIEKRLADPQVILNSFIVASTPAKEVLWWEKGMTKDDLEKCNVLFQQDDRDTYIGKLLRKAVML